MGWYRVFLSVGGHRKLLWPGTDCCWQEDDPEWYCGLVQSVAASRTAQSVIVDWYRVLLAVGRYRVALWAGTECF